MSKLETISFLGIELGKGVRSDSGLFSSGIIYLDNHYPSKLHVEKLYPSTWFRKDCEIPIDYDWVIFKLEYSTGEYEITVEDDGYKCFGGNIFHTIKLHPDFNIKRQKKSGQPRA